MAFRFAPNLSTMFYEAASLQDRYQMALSCGFSGVECQNVYDLDLDELTKFKERSGLEQVLINSCAGEESDEFGFALDPGHMFKSYLSKSLYYAQRLKCKRVHIIAGLKTDEYTFAEMEEIYLSNMLLAAQACERANVIGVIEPLCKEVKPNYFLTSFEKAVEYVREINSDHLKLLLDVYHLQMTSGNITNTIKSVMPHVGHVQISQAPYRNEPSAPGELNYRYILSVLASIGYAGWIGLEYYPSGTTTAGLQWIHDYGYMM